MNRKSNLRPSSYSFIAAALLMVYSAFAALAQESFTLSTFPTPTRKPDGSREIANDTNIAGRWRSQSGQIYSCSQAGKGFVCRAETAIESAGLKSGDVALAGSVYEHVAIASFLNRFPAAAGGIQICPLGYFDGSQLVLRISDDAKMMRGELLMRHRDENCRVDGATVQEAVLHRID